MSRLMLLFLANALSLTVHCQVTDDFLDMEFTSNPTWSGTDSDFVVNSSGQLQTNNSAAATSYLATPHLLNDLENKEWRFYAKMNFAGSATNFVRIYLTADNTNLNLVQNGYYLQLGEAGSNDAVRLFKLENGTSTQLLASANGSIASSATVGVKIIRSNLGDWTVQLDLSGGTTYQVIGTVNDASSLLGSHTGIITTYTVSNVKKVFLDNVYVGPEVIDVIPPLLQSVTVIDALTLKLNFSEEVLTSSVETISNYTFLPNLNLVTAVQSSTNPKEVTLTFDVPFINGQLVTIELQDVEDLAGNSTSVSGSFTYLFSEIPIVGDLIINEMMVDPSPIIGLPEVEFVEIYNRSTKYFNLSGWKIGDNATFGTISAEWIAPGEYKVLCASANVSLFSNAVGVTSFPSYNNDLDAIILKSDQGVIVDQLTYSSTWYRDEEKKQGGYTLERINPFSECSNHHNWIASNAVSGGTPNAPNSVFDSTPDIVAPSIISVTVNHAQQITILFSEGLDSTQATQSNYQFTPNLTMVSREIIGQFPDKVTLNFSDQFISGQLYSFTINAVSDCSGNSTDLSGQFQFLLAETPDYNDLIINEMMVNPAPVIGLPEVEFVEIYNRSTKYFNLSGWKIGDNTTFGTITAAWIAPGEYKVLCATANVSLFSNAVGVTSFPSYNNDLDAIILKSDQEVIVDQLTYSSTWYQDEEKKQGGYTLERINPFLSCSNNGNWRASNDVLGGTPGFQNSIYNDAPDITGPVFMYAEIIDSISVKLHFNEGLDSVSAMMESITFNPNLTSINRVVEGQFSTWIQIHFANEITTSLLYQFEINLLKDCSNNGSHIVGSFIRPDKLLKNDLIINEILFNPLTGGSDFIELKNISSKMIELKGMVISNAKGTSSSEKLITKSKLMPPNGIVLISADTLFLQQNYPFTSRGNYVMMDLPSFSNDSSTIKLINDSVVIDAVSYSAKWHFKLIDDVKGKSLERIDPNQPANQSSNWHTAAELVGFATPGIENSQYSPSLTDGTFNLTSETFSPDNDGFEDVLQLNYEMADNGMLANVTIFDDRGRIVRKLIANELLGIKGFFSWDGLTDGGLKASVGTYIILFEAFNPTNGVKFYKKKVCVLAGRI